MARTTIRVEIPTNGDNLIALITAIIAQDAKLNKATPGSSPIDPKLITALTAVLAAAKQPRLDARNLQAQADTLMQGSDNALGIGEGQNVRTDGTGLFLVTKLRDRMLADFKGEESQLEPFGFSVSIGSASSPQRAQSAEQAKKAA